MKIFIRKFNRKIDNYYERSEVIRFGNAVNINHL